MSKQQNRLNELSKRFLIIKEKKKKYEVKYEKLRTDLKDEIESTEKNFVRTNLFNIKLSKSVKVTYDIMILTKRLKKLFKKKVLKKLIIKRYEISDIDAFKELMKEHDVPFNEVKQVIEVITTINQREIDRMIDDEKLSLNDLDGCYTTTESGGTLYINEVGD